MGFYRIGNALAGKPGVGLYDVTPEQLRACCCGWRVNRISFVTIGQPDCFLQAQGTPDTGCTGGVKSAESALALALTYIGQLNYITKCNPTALNPDPETNFCQNKIPVFTYREARDTQIGYEFDFDVEDCGIEPVDYLATIIVEACG